MPTRSSTGRRDTMPMADGPASACLNAGRRRRTIWCYRWVVALAFTLVLAGPQLGVSIALAEILGATPREFPDSLFGVAIAGPGNVIATGYHGAVKVSADGGQTWTRVDIGNEDLLRRVTVAPGGAIFAVSHKGKILKGSADGKTWSVVHDAPGLYLRDIAFATADVGWAVGHDGIILNTVDGGKTWATQELENYQGRDKPRLSGVAVIDAAHAVVVGEFGVIAQTSDGGRKWPIVTSTILPTLLSVVARDGVGYAVGLNGTLVQLTIPRDGLLSFSQIATGTLQHLLTVALSPDRKTALIGGYGLLLTVSNGMLAPAKVSSDFILDYSWIGGVAIGEEGHSVAVGLGGAILRADTPSGTFVPVPARPVAAETTTASDRVIQ